MNIISLLKEEHKAIERELLELENILEDSTNYEESSELNFPNILHTLKKLIDIWNLHEAEEELIFPILRKQEIAIEIEKMLFDHKKLKKYKEDLLNSLNNAGVFEIKQALKRDIPPMSKELREHINFEDEILYTATLKNTSELELDRLKTNFPNLGKWL